MPSVRFFRDLDAWQAAMDLAVESHRLADTLPSEQRYALAADIRRSATSIPSNIAEGHSYGSDRVFLRHVRIATGSLGELESQLEIAGRLKLISAEAMRHVSQGVDRTGQLLSGLRRMLRRTESKLSEDR